ncbi:MAG: hypothetical protein E7D78_10440, partial [Prevotella bivia]|nr:hypothetical protein [Prevotella bivia]
AECSLSYAKIVQMNAIQTCLNIAECSLSYAKIAQMNAIQTCLNIAECSLSYAKIYILKYLCTTPTTCFYYSTIYFFELRRILATSKHTKFQKQRNIIR